MVAGVASAVLVGGFLGGTAARADSAPTDPADPLTPVTVTADSLPTVQIDGVAWSQAVVGDTVYVAGRFGSARPAGAPAGTQETTRNNLLAYDIRTGELLTSFAPDLNGQALVVRASPDGSRIYVGGDFTTADGKPRYRIAAFSTATGQLISTFQPVVGHQVAAIAATDSTVYFGGSFATVGGVSRLRMAAVSAADGSLLPWNPVPGAGINRDGSTATNFAVTSMVVADGGAKVVVAGRFGYLNGVAATGIGALHPATGETLPFAVNKLVTNQGDDSAVYSLSTDGTLVYGSGYDFGGPGNVEGAFAARASTGELVWMADCHGDTYSTAPVGGALYVAGHPHVCSNIGGWPEASPRLSQYAMAYSTAPSATTVGTSTLRNANFQGKPAPAILPWYPTFLSGTVTGQGQAGWSVDGTSEYVVYAGEFPGVNNKAQAGLARFAVPGRAPNLIGPDEAAGLTPTAVSFAAGSARVTWSTTTDRDNAGLTYTLHRSGRATPVHQVTAPSEYRKPGKQLTFLDTGLTPGETYTYSVTATDPFGNARTGGSRTVTVSTAGSAGGAYAATVRHDGARDHWRLGEPGGATAYDHGPAAMDLDVYSGVTRGRSGALTGDNDTAYQFSGTSTGLAGTRTAAPAPQTFSIETFVRTTTTKGGKVVGFGSARTSLSGTYDRHLYLDRSGYLTFGVLSGGERTLRTPARINDNTWHHVVGTLSAEGMKLYVDGELVGTRADTTSALAYNGYWRIGGDRTWGSNNGTWFSGQVDEVAIYPTALTAEQVADHHDAALTGVAANVPPSAAFTADVADLTVALDAATSTDVDGTIASYRWALGDGSTASGATTSHTYAAAGTYPVTLTVTDDDGATASAVTQVTVTDPAPNVGPTASFTSSVARLTAELDAAGSADADGTLESYAWDFGDGSTGTGATASHTYATAGTYTVTLTVTDDDGASASTSGTVTLTPTSSTPVATDTFGRTSASGFGTADTGGAWTISGGLANATVSDGVGRLSVPTKGGSVSAYLNSVSALDTAVQFRTRLTEMPTGGGTYVYAVARHVGSTDYRMGARISSAGAVTAQVSRVVNGAETVLRSAAVEGLTYTPGTWLTLRFDVSGEGTTTLAGKAWVVGSAEPSGWHVTATDGTAALQRAGGVGARAYVSGSATVVPVRADIDDLWAGAAGTVPAPGQLVNAAPTASAVSTVDGLTVALDGSSSTDVDGRLTAHTWDLGDGSTATGATASHTYAAAGTYAVTLTVTDDTGAAGTTTLSVAVREPNVPPVAAFGTATSGLSAALSATGSADEDGRIESYAWDFGDGSTGTGVTASHTYATAGTYTVTLTVTDDRGGSATASQAVTVTGVVTPPLAADTFGRDSASGFGTAETGGAWTISGGAANATIADGVGRMSVVAKGGSLSAYLNSVSALDTAVQVRTRLAAAPTGGGTYVYAVARQVGSSGYRLGVRVSSTGDVSVQVSRVVNGAETLLRSNTVEGLTYTPGTWLTLRFDVSGDGTATLAGKVWADGSAEPEGWQVTATDGTAALQRAGGVGVRAYVSGSATVVPVRVDVDDLWAGAAGLAPGE